jgi:hypothetical protein
MTELTETQITKAVEWWADKLVSCKFDNGDSSETGQMLMMMARMARLTVTAEQVATFKESLAKLLWEDGVGVYGSIGVDYDPDKMLRAALDASGINGGYVLPWKTHMGFENGGVQVTYGYCAPWEEL